MALNTTEKQTLASFFGKGTTEITSIDGTSAAAASAKLGISRQAIRTQTASMTTPIIDVPGMPASATPTPGSGQVSLAFTAPSDTGGSAVTSYRVTDLADPSKTTTGAASPIVLSGLSAGSHTVQVAAINAQGQGGYRVAAPVTVT